MVSINVFNVGRIMKITSNISFRVTMASITFLCSSSIGSAFAQRTFQELSPGVTIERLKTDLRAGSDLSFIKNDIPSEIIDIDKFEYFRFRISSKENLSAEDHCNHLIDRAKRLSEKEGVIIVGYLQRSGSWAGLDVEPTDISCELIYPDGYISFYAKKIKPQFASAATPNLDGDWLTWTVDDATRKSTPPKEWLQDFSFFSAGVLTYDGMVGDNIGKSVRIGQYKGEPQGYPGYQGPRYVVRHPDGMTRCLRNIGSDLSTGCKLTQAGDRVDLAWGHWDQGKFVPGSLKGQIFVRKGSALAKQMTAVAAAPAKPKPAQKCDIRSIEGHYERADGMRIGILGVHIGGGALVYSNARGAIPWPKNIDKFSNITLQSGCTYKAMCATVKTSGGASVSHTDTPCTLNYDPAQGTITASGSHGTFRRQQTMED